MSFKNAEKNEKNENPDKLLCYRSRIEHLYKYHIIDKYHRRAEYQTGWMTFETIANAVYTYSMYLL